MHRPWPLIFFVVLAGVTALALWPQPPKVIDLGWDKLNHVAAFAVLALLAHRAAWRSPLPAIAAWMLGWGLWIELAQGLGTTRQADWHDLVADAVGILIGIRLSTLRQQRGRG